MGMWTKTSADAYLDNEKRRMKYAGQPMDRLAVQRDYYVGKLAKIEQCMLTEEEVDIEVNRLHLERIDEAMGVEVGSTFAHRPVVDRGTWAGKTGQRIERAWLGCLNTAARAHPEWTYDDQAKEADGQVACYLARFGTPEEQAAWARSVKERGV